MELASNGFNGFPQRLSRRDFHTIPASGQALEEHQSPLEKLAQEVAGILHSDYHHPSAPIKRTTLHRVWIQELTAVRRFLVGKILKNTLERVERVKVLRPVYPQAKTQANFAYKKAMIDYIATFGYVLEDAPCSYTPAFLEAFANYCERHTNLEDNKGAGKKKIPKRVEMESRV